MKDGNTDIKVVWFKIPVLMAGIIAAMNDAQVGAMLKTNYKRIKLGG